MMELRLKLIQLRNNLFGPKISDDEIAFLRLRAALEGWSDWLMWVEAVKSTKKRRWWLYYLKEGLITVYTPEIAEQDAALEELGVYDDDDPFEIDR